MPRKRHLCSCSKGPRLGGHGYLEGECSRCRGAANDEALAALPHLDALSKEEADARYSARFHEWVHRTMRRRP